MDLGFAARDRKERERERDGDFRIWFGVRMGGRGSDDDDDKVVFV